MFWCRIYQIAAKNIFYIITSLTSDRKRVIPYIEPCKKTCGTTDESVNHVQSVVILFLMRSYFMLNQNVLLLHVSECRVNCIRERNQC